MIGQSYTHSVCAQYPQPDLFDDGIDVHRPRVVLPNLPEPLHDLAYDVPPYVVLLLECGYECDSGGCVM